MYNFGAIGEGINGSVQAGYGLYQSYKGNQAMKKLVRPTYQIPTELKDKMTAAQQMAMEGLPEEQKQQYVNNLQRSTNFGLNALSDRKAGIAGLSTLVQNADDGYNNLLVQDSAAKRQNQMYLGQVQSEMAGYKDKTFEVNEFNPYLQKYQDAKALQGAGQQNIWSGMGSISNSGSSFFGGGGAKSTTPQGGGGYGQPNNGRQGAYSFNMSGQNAPATSQNPNIGLYDIDQNNSPYQGYNPYGKF